MASLNLDVSPSMCSRWNNSAFPSPGIEEIAEQAAIPDAKADKREAGAPSGDPLFASARCAVDPKQKI
jgi:hypothetical protein